MLKKILFLVFAVEIGFISKAQDVVVSNLRTATTKEIKKDPDTLQFTWKRGGLFNANFAQGSLSNWAAGGDNFTMSINSYFNYFIYHLKGRKSWDNNVDINLGFVQTTSTGMRKNDDRIDLLSKFGYKMDTTSKWYLSGLFNFRSQFFDGYSYSNNIGDFSSTILAPGYVTLAIGFDYKPNSHFSIFLSPLTSRTTIVLNKTLSNKGAYGVDTGSTAKYELGAYASVNYNNTIAKGITYKGRVDLFSNYLHNPQNVDLFMTNLFSFKINKYFSATYSLDLIYDDDVRQFGPNASSPGLQTKSLIGIGFLKQLNVKRVTTTVVKQ